MTCWNTRPQEKLWYIIYNVAMQCLSIFIIILDIVFVSSKQAKKHRRNKKQRGSTRHLVRSRAASIENLMNDFEIDQLDNVDDPTDESTTGEGK